MRRYVPALLLLNSPPENLWSCSKRALTCSDPLVPTYHQPPGTPTYHQVEDKWSENHCKLVYLISRWGRSALSPEEKESWLRQVGGLLLSACAHP